MLEQCGFNGKVELKVKDGALIITRPRRKRKAREGWADKIRRSVEKHGAPELLWPEDMQDSFDAEWTWPEEKP